MFNPIRKLADVLVKHTEAYKASDAMMNETLSKIAEIEKKHNLPAGTLTK